MVRGDQSKLLFIDSTVATHNDRVKLMLPSSAFTADAGDRIALTLQSFSMRRNFYSIHKYNSIFYVKVETDLVEIQIAHGSYDTFDKLATAIQTAMRTQLELQRGRQAAEGEFELQVPVCRPALLLLFRCCSFYVSIAAACRQPRSCCVCCCSCD